MGQSLGVPIWKLLGGRSATRPAYANGWYQAQRDRGHRGVWPRVSSNAGTAG